MLNKIQTVEDNLLTSSDQSFFKSQEELLNNLAYQTETTGNDEKKVKVIKVRNKKKDQTRRVSTIVKDTKPLLFKIDSNQGTIDSINEESSQNTSIEGI